MRWRQSWAARYVEQIAGAIQYAHELGVVHRDVKPSNVLIDQTDNVRITDFGLAKLVTTEEESELTGTGQVLGTPSFMPPEQALGRIKEVTEASDIYSIGATLYALTTGRPPFQAATPLDTLKQVLDRAPVSPRQLNAKIPLDLETICLKCLEKDPHKRYGSANELAEELRRFQAGQPIVARPVSRITHAKRWCQRNPVVSSFAAVATVSLLAFVLTILVAYFREAALLVASEKSKNVAIKSMYVLSRSAQDRLEHVEGEEVREVRKLLIETARVGLEEIALTMEDEISKAVITATSHRFRGDMHMEEGEFEEALKEFETCRVALEPTLGAPKYEFEPWIPLFNLVRAEDRMAEANKELKRYDEAQVHLENAYRYRKQLIPLESHIEKDVDKQFAKLETSAQNAGVLYRKMGDATNALKYFQVVYESRQKTFANKPDNLIAKQQVAGSYFDLGSMYVLLGDYQQAIDYLRTAATMIKQVSKARGDKESITSANVAMFHIDWGKVLEYSSDAAKAINLYEQAEQRIRPIYEKQPSVYWYRIVLWRSLYRLATAKLSTDPGASKDLFDEALEYVPKNTVHHLWTLARCHQVDEAERLADKLVPTLSATKDLYEVSCVYAICAWSAKVNANDSEPDEDEQKRFESFTTKTISTLKVAIQKGFGSIAEMNNNPEFDAVRDTSDFQGLLRQLEIN